MFNDGSASIVNFILDLELQVSVKPIVTDLQLLFYLVFFSTKHFRLFCLMVNSSKQIHGASPVCLAPLPLDSCRIH